MDTILEIKLRSIFKEEHLDFCRHSCGWKQLFPISGNRVFIKSFITASVCGFWVNFKLNAFIQSFFFLLVESIKISWQFSWKLVFIGLLLVFTYISDTFIYLSSYSFFFSHLFNLLTSTFILPIYHFFPPLSQFILYYLLCTHSVISLFS